jgi:hypothetical protein
VAIMTWIDLPHHLYSYGHVKLGDAATYTPIVPHGFHHSHILLIHYSNVLLIEDSHGVVLQCHRVDIK